MITITRRDDPKQRTKSYILSDTDLYVQGEATDHIWGMVEHSGKIGLRFDSGDAGTVYLTKRQAHETINTLNDLLSQM